QARRRGAACGEPIDRAKKKAHGRGSARALASGAEWTNCPARTRTWTAGAKNRSAAIALRGRESRGGMQRGTALSVIRRSEWSRRPPRRPYAGEIAAPAGGAVLAAGWRNLPVRRGRVNPGAGF